MKLAVYLHREKTGTLESGPDGLSFRYCAGWTASPGSFAVSLSLPLSDQPFPPAKASPFFAGLLPEAGIRRQIANRLGVSPQNDFGLLAAIGKECAGALSFWPEGEPPDFSGGYTPLAPKKLAQRICNPKNGPLIYNPRGLRLSLAGAQEKTALALKGGKWFEPDGMAASSHILKPPIEGLSSTVENEAFCMRLAKRVGLPVPEAWIVKIKPPVFAVERYDRREMQGTFERIHQEDFCQALGIHPDSKYETEGGPGLRACFELLKRHSADPLGDQKHLLDWVVFNYCIGNADAHAKNVSWFVGASGFKLAPFYDLLSTAAYPDLSDKLAMQIGGEARLDWISARHWERFAQEAGIQPKFVLKTARDMGQKILREAKTLFKEFTREHGTRKVIQTIIKRIEKQAGRV